MADGGASFWAPALIGGATNVIGAGINAHAAGTASAAETAAANHAADVQAQAQAAALAFAQEQFAQAQAEHQQRRQRIDATVGKLLGYGPGQLPNRGNGSEPMDRAGGGAAGGPVGAPSGSVGAMLAPPSNAAPAPAPAAVVGTPSGGSIGALLAPSGGAGGVRMTGPNGQTGMVPPELVPHYLAQGATLAQGAA